jgi:hypothetical protein
MMKDRKDPNESEAHGHDEDHGNQQQASRPSGQDRQEQYQRTKANPDANLSRGTPADREARLRRRAHKIWEREGRPEGMAQEHWNRAAQDLDREDADIHSDDRPGGEPGAGTGPEKKPKCDRT